MSSLKFNRFMIPTNLNLHLYHSWEVFISLRDEKYFTPKKARY